MVVFCDLFDVEALNLRMQEQYKGKEPYKGFTTVMRAELCYDTSFVIMVVVSSLMSFYFKQKLKMRWLCINPQCEISFLV